MRSGSALHHLLEHGVYIDDGDHYKLSGEYDGDSWSFDFGRVQRGR